MDFGWLEGKIPTETSKPHVISRLAENTRSADALDVMRYLNGSQRTARDLDGDSLGFQLPPCPVVCRDHGRCWCSSASAVHRISGPLKVLVVMTHYSASVAKCRRLSVSWSLLFGLAVLSLRIVTVWAQDEEGTDQTEHAALIEELEIDFDSLQQSGEVDLSSDDPVVAAHNALQPMLGNLEDRLAALFAKTSTTECRAKIARHFNYFLAAIGKEEGLPFADSTFVNECPEPVYDWYNLPEGIHVGHIQNRTYQPPRNESVYIEPEELRLLYAVLAHDDPASTIRLMDALYEPGHLFVIHVDGKEASDETYRQLVDYAATRDHVHVLCAARRVRVNWGGFSMVNATLQILHYAFCVDEVDCTPLEFHKVVHLASSSYPLASNTEIRSTITDYPLDANFLHVILKPLRPPRTSWSYFVECDDFVHRIYRLESLQNSTSGMELYTSSQWFIMSREFAEYIAEARPGTFVHQFLEYVQHVVVADETFFGTVLRHTKFCTTHHNSNFLHLQFDRWESDLPEGKRDERKCMMKDPDHCGRSPTTMTTDYADILELTSDLFARKFVDLVDSQVKDIVDEWRVKREADPEAIKNFQQKGLGFEGHGVLIVAKDTVQDEVPLCLGLGDTGNKLKLVPCFYEEVVPSLADEWETGAVILEETQWHNRWQVGPCTSDGAVQRK